MARYFVLDRSIIKTVHFKAMINWICRAAHFIHASYCCGCRAVQLQTNSNPYPRVYYLILDTISAMIALHLHTHNPVLMNVTINISKSYFKSEMHNKMFSYPSSFHLQCKLVHVFTWSGPRGLKGDAVLSVIWPVSRVCVHQYRMLYVVNSEGFSHGNTLWNSYTSTRIKSIKNLKSWKLKGMR